MGEHGGRVGVADGDDRAELARRDGHVDRAAVDLDLGVPVRRAATRGGAADEVGAGEAGERTVGEQDLAVVDDEHAVGQQFERGGGGG